MGRKPVVVLNSYAAIKEAFVRQGDVFAGRPPMFITDDMAGMLGLAASEGPLWKEQRHFALGVLKDFGMGKTYMEPRIQDEITIFLAEIEKENGVAFDMWNIIGKAVANIICLLVFGERVTYDNEDIQLYLEYLNKNVEHIGASSVLNYFPFLKYIPGDPFKFKEALENDEPLTEFLERTIAEHKKTHSPVNIKDFLDAYLKEMAAQEKINPGKHGFTDDQLLEVISDLFAAGTDTMINTLRWGILYLAINQDIQAKIHQELDDNIGTEAMISMADKPKVPYTDACIMEIQRFANIIPFALPHSTTEDVKFRQYMLPKGTMIFPNIWAALADSKLWKNPDEFDPRNFLDDKGKVNKPAHFIPFSLGKRMCLGESLARTELFLFFTSMLQRFHFRLPPDLPLPSLQGKIGLTICALPYKVLAIKRTAVL
ncbi:unnamed protein product [Owenia fusiformis]|uniref:Cytochrome P450 n=1 Tax=Owenia fusiformis TaxID=6347 RepID=A0A8S4N4J2_OWEFU|nr:unnamed protein product [Owenia fusiformis]